MIRIRQIEDHKAGAWGDWEFHEWVFTDLLGMLPPAPQSKPLGVAP